MVCCLMQALIFVIYLLTYLDGWMCILEAGNEDGFYGSQEKLCQPLCFATTLRVFFSAMENNVCFAEQRDSISL